MSFYTLQGKKQTDRDTRITIMNLVINQLKGDVAECWILVGLPNYYYRAIDKTLEFLSEF